MISAAQIAMMRSHLAKDRTTPCQILRNQPASDGWGGTSENWVDVTPSGLTCRVAPERQRGTEQVAEERLEGRDYYLLYFDPDIDQPPTSLSIKDRLVALGLTFEIIELGPRSRELEHSARCVRLS
jgi:hypothetical protein